MGENRESVQEARPLEGALRRRDLLELHFFMRLSREWDLRFEKLFRTGAVGKWYSSVGNEATTVAAATAIEAGDALCTLHRDGGAILRHYLDPQETLPGVLEPGPGLRQPCAGDSGQRLFRLACQLLGKAEGFSQGYERSYHYGLFDDATGMLHLGMVSHLGAMIPVAAGLGLAFRQQGKDRVALNFIGDGGTSTGDFHEGLNMAAVLKLPLILIVENNGFAFSTPLRQQCAAPLSARAEGYGIPGVRVDGGDPGTVYREVSEAVARARRGDGPTLIEAVLGRLRGHSEGDDSLKQVPEGAYAAFLEADPVARFEDKLVAGGLVSRDYLDDLSARCARLVLEVVDRALAAPDPEPSPQRRVYAD